MGRVFYCGGASRSAARGSPSPVVLSDFGAAVCLRAISPSLGDDRRRLCFCRAHLSRFAHRGLMKFPLHTQDSAPEASKPLLAQVESAFGFVPNLTATLAESPAALAGYMQLSTIIEKNSALSPREQQVVMLAVSESNACDYCVAAHSLIAGMSGLPEDTVAALRDGRVLPDAKEAALAQFAKAVVNQRGWVSDADQEAFLAAGFTRQHLLDVLSIIALKTLSNYANHVAHTPLDAAFEAHRWTKSP